MVLISILLDPRIFGSTNVTFGRCSAARQAHPVHRIILAKRTTVPDTSTQETFGAWVEVFTERL